jgi:cellulose synthase/poly-beta-1,6-N-acetylglucosamine synthase-like glycosyltransferase
MYLNKQRSLLKRVVMINFIPEFGYNAGTYLFLSFAFFGLIHFLFVVLVYTRLAFHRDKKEAVKDKLPGVSVIIAARNESNNIYNNLPFILDQNYPEFEVIVVNHQSVDDSQYILDAYKRQFPNLRTIIVEKNVHLKYGKKLPLTIGIKGAKYQHMLFTDADCKPASSNWLRSMATSFTEKKQIVLGYGPYKREKGLLNRFVRFDTAWIAMNYFSMAKARVPYMGIGRNMAYTKNAFENANGFKSHYSLSSGDDDLFIQDAAKKKNYTINIDPDSFCYSKGARSWSHLLKQKSRHYTTADKYRVFKKLMLGIYPLTLLIMTGTFVTLMFDSNFIWLSLSIYLFILTTKWIVIGRSFSKLKESKFIAWLPFLDLIYSIWTPIMYYAVDKTDTKKW